MNLNLAGDEVMTEGEKATSGDITKGLTEGEKVRFKTPSKRKQPTKKGRIAQKKRSKSLCF